MNPEKALATKASKRSRSPAKLLTADGTAKQTAPHE
jgi:hypothetical protein